jgi:AcrR family transcriptional regulator
MSDECQKALIIEVARKIFQAEGYDGVTMNDIATECKVSKKTLYRLFSSKQEMLVEIVAQHRFAMVALPGDYDDMPTEQALEAIFRVDISDEEDFDRIAFLRLIMTETAKSKEVLDVVMEHAAGEGTRLLSDWLTDKCSSGELTIEDIPLTVDILFDMVFGSIIMRCEPGCELPSHEDRKNKMRHAIKIFVRGCRPR